LPVGWHLVSFYFFNKDSHDGRNKLRDFILSAKVLKLGNEFFEKLQDENGKVISNVVQNFPQKFGQYTKRKK
jgi:hypothetical protein